MANTRVDQMISVVGSHLYQPVADLLGQLLKMEPQLGDRVSSGFYESGYSAAIILLLCTMVESFVQRDRYFLERANPKLKTSYKIASYVQTELKYRRGKRIAELFEVRNAIAHNHMWETYFSLKSGGGRTHKKSAVVAKSHRLSNPPTQNVRIPRTQILKIHFSPSNLNRTDVKKSLITVIHLLAHMSCRGSNPVNLINDHVILNKKRVQFSELSNEI